MPDTYDQAMQALRAILAIRPRPHFNTHLTVSAQSWAINVWPHQPTGRRQDGIQFTKPETVSKHGDDPCTGTPELVEAVSST